MIDTSDTMTDVKGNKYIVFTVGTTEFTVLAGDNKRIFAKGSLTHVIDEPVLVDRILKKYGITFSGSVL